MPSCTGKKLDAIVCATPHHVYYFSGYWTSWLNQSAFILFADGRSWLCTANQEATNVAAEEAVAYEANWMGTQRQDQAATVAGHVRTELASRRVRQFGMDASRVGSHVAMVWRKDCQRIDEELWQLRRRKDADELETMKSAIRCCDAMYQRVKEMIEPGIPELEVYTQMQAWEAVVESHRIVQRMARPGARCRDIFAAVHDFLKQRRGSGMPHHLGHGVGLEPHECPHLNPRWDDVLMEGEVFTAEPGQYGPELGGGVRIENQYLVTADGVENLVAFPLELV